MATDIGLSRKQRVFAVLEDTVGTLKMPQAAVTFVVNEISNFLVGDVEVTYDGLAGGLLPTTGMFYIGTELITYTGVTVATATTGTITGLTRGAWGTTAAEHADDTVGSLVVNEFIRPAGNAVMNQNPNFVDSEELSDSLDVLEQFQSAFGAGEFSVPTYVRPHGTQLWEPQGAALWRSLQGTLNPHTTAAINDVDGITSGDTTITYDTLAGGVLPTTGVVLIGTEQILYTGKTTTTLTGCTRGYNSTTAATHADDAVITLKSIFYRQATSSPSFSLWIETDHFVQGMSGCSVNQVNISLSNEGGTKAEFSGQGMQMYWAGTDALQAQAASNATALVVEDADRYSVGAYIYNSTQTEHNSGEGYKITAINTTTNTLTITNGAAGGIESQWESGDVIKGYLPTATAIGTAIEGRHSAVTLNGVAATFKNTTLNIGAPKQYVTDEVGTQYPTKYMENVRNITSTLGIYFRKQDAKYFNEGYLGNNVPIAITIGNAQGLRMRLYIKRAKLEVPQISPNPPAIELNMPMKALGTVGEDSLETVFD